MAILRNIRGALVCFVLSCFSQALAEQKHASLHVVFRTGPFFEHIVPPTAVPLEIRASTDDDGENVSPGQPVAPHCRDYIKIVCTRPPFVFSVPLAWRLNAPSTAPPFFFLRNLERCKNDVSHASRVNHYVEGA